VALSDAHRNYKDRNHKPEVHVALTEFWMLHGFRPLEEIAGLLKEVPELRPVMPDFAQRLAAAKGDASLRKALLRALYERVMNLPQAGVDAILKPLVERLQVGGGADKSRREFWVTRAANEFPLPGGHMDRGIFSIYLLNLVHLRPGEATYQPAGTLHAYLEGVNVELMANSDNVLRGGLTPKHVDVPELMRILDFQSGRPEVIRGETFPGGETVYRTPAAEFELSRIVLRPEGPAARVGGVGPQVLLALEGETRVRTAGVELRLSRGGAALIPHGVECELHAAAAGAELFHAGLPGSSRRPFAGQR
jgi:mannose-6-phosphate isomerase